MKQTNQCIPFTPRQQTESTTILKENSCLIFFHYLSLKDGKASPNVVMIVHQPHPMFLTISSQLQLLQFVELFHL